MSDYLPEPSYEEFKGAALAEVTTLRESVERYRAELAEAIELLAEAIELLRELQRKVEWIQHDLEVLRDDVWDRIQRTLPADEEIRKKKLEWALNKLGYYSAENKDDLR